MAYLTEGLLVEKYAVRIEYRYSDEPEDTKHVEWATGGSRGTSINMKVAFLYSKYIDAKRRADYENRSENAVYNGVRLRTATVVDVICSFEVKENG